MREHSDFIGGRNPPRTIPSTEPNFQLVRRSDSRIVLVLDISGSMSTKDCGSCPERITRLAQVATYLDSQMSYKASVITRNLCDSIIILVL